MEQIQGYRPPHCALFSVSCNKMRRKKKKENRVMHET